MYIYIYIYQCLKIHVLNITNENKERLQKKKKACERYQNLSKA